MTSPIVDLRNTPGGNSAKREKATRKADELLKAGDALAQTKPAESRRLLRECRRYRRLARELGQ